MDRLIVITTIQGLFLVPLLFTVYVNDIVMDIKASIAFFADGTTLFYSSKCPIHLHSVLPQERRTLYNWSKVWNVNVNPKKIVVTTISNHRRDQKILSILSGTAPRFKGT